MKCRSKFRCGTFLICEVPMKNGSDYCLKHNRIISRRTITRFQDRMKAGCCFCAVFFVKKASHIRAPPSLQSAQNTLKRLEKIEDEKIFKKIFRNPP